MKELIAGIVFGLLIMFILACFYEIKDHCSEIEKLHIKIDKVLQQMTN